MGKTEFNPIDDLEILSQTEKMFIVRTAYLLPTLMFMQNAGWRLQEIIPDDEGVDEHNILVYCKGENATEKN